MKKASEKDMEDIKKEILLEIKITCVALAVMLIGIFTLAKC